jgi:RNA polymerase sigma-70 factor (ECF subfamily)
MQEKALDEKILEKIYLENIDKIYRFFYYKTLSKEIAEDLTSETFIAFINELKSNKEILDLVKFLFGIAKIIFVKFLRSKYKENTINLPDIFEFQGYVQDFLEEIDSSETLEDLLLKYIDQIPEKQRIVLELRLIKKLKIKEIAEKLNKDVNYVKTTQKRALKSIKEIVNVEFNAEST